MTLPNDIYLPKPDDFQRDPNKYVDNLTFQLQEMYLNIVQNVNGTLRNYADVDGSEWIPTLNGSGAGTFTYTSQYGWVLRQGLMTDVWGDVTWSATTATGNLYVDLPYIVTKSSGSPFIGVCQPSNVTYTAGTMINISAIPGTYTGEFWTSGTGVATGNQAVVASGRLIFHVRYIGVTGE
jgi:hypothetical protein